MTQSLIRWCTAIVLFVMLVCIMLTRPAGAEWPNDAFNCRAYRSDLYWQSWARKHCRGWRRWKRHGTTTRYVVRSRGDALCQPVTEATGEQAQREDTARESALTAWRGRVRFKYGERYTDFDHARDKRVGCAPSSVPDAYRDQKLPPLFRCELIAKPCRVEAKRIGR